MLDAASKTEVRVMRSPDTLYFSESTRFEDDPGVELLPKQISS